MYDAEKSDRLVPIATAATPGVQHGFQRPWHALCFAYNGLSCVCRLLVQCLVQCFAGIGSFLASCLLACLALPALPAAEAYEIGPPLDTLDRVEG